MSAITLLAFFAVFCFGCVSGVVLHLVFRSKHPKKNHAPGTLVRCEKRVSKRTHIRELLEKELTQWSPFGMLWCVVDARKKVVSKHKDFVCDATLPPSPYALQFFRNTAVDACIARALHEQKPHYAWNAKFLDSVWDVHVIPWRYDDVFNAPALSTTHEEELYALVACMPPAKAHDENFDTVQEDFLQNVAHEIKNPLTSIIGFAELLHKDAQNTTLVERIQRQSRRLFSIVESIALLTQKRDDGNFTTLRVDTCITQAIEQLDEHAHDKQIRVNYERTGNSALHVMGNAPLLITALTNVIKNAIEHSTHGDVITVKMSTGCIEGTPHIFVYIIDKGAGILEADKSKVFDRFYRGNVGKSRARGGTGLGLAITKRVLEMHGGTVSLATEAGKGSTFTFAIPHVSFGAR